MDSAIRKRRVYTYWVAVVENEKRFSLIGRGITYVNQINQLEYLKLIAPLRAVKSQLLILN